MRHRLGGTLAATTTGALWLVLGATLSCGGETVTTDPTAPTVAKVTVSPSSTTVAVGSTTQFSAVAADSTGTVIPGTVTWSSSSPAVATVDTKGSVTAVAGGTATISAAMNGKSGSGSINVTVPVATITVTGKAALVVGDTATFAPATLDATGAPLTGRSVTWSTSAPTVATVSTTGLVTAAAAGTATISAAAEGKSGSVNVTVAAATGTVAYTVTVTGDIPTSLRVPGRGLSVFIDGASVGALATNDAGTAQLTAGTHGISLVGLPSLCAIQNGPTVSVTITGNATTAASVPVVCQASALGGSKDVVAFVSTRDGHFQVYSMNTDGTGQTRLASTTTDDYFVSWSPDGKKLTFVSTRTGGAEIYSINPDGTGVAAVTTDGQWNVDPTWAPDGQRIAYTSYRGGAWDIYTASVSGGTATQLTSSAGFDGNASWSPDGLHIAFKSERNGKAEIYVMNADGSSPTRLTTAQGDEADPSWSPDSKKIAFTSHRDGHAEIYRMNVDGTAQTRLTTGTADNVAPDWSADGTKIVFHSERDGDRELYTMNADGTSQTRLTFVSGQDQYAHWRPSRALVVSPVATVLVTPGTATMTVAGTTQYSAVTRDQSGAVLAGRTVAWTSSNTQVATVSLSGLVTGVAAGTATITATSETKSGTGTATVTATVTAKSIAVNAGNNLSAAAGTALATSPSVIVKDASGNGVSGVSVTFAVASGGGSITGATQTTDGFGIATVGSWTLGATAGTNTLTATSTGLTGSPVTFTAAGVSATPVASVVINGFVTSVAGNTLHNVDVNTFVTISATVFDALGNPLKGRLVTWTPKDSTIVKLTPYQLAASTDGLTNATGQESVNLRGRGVLGYINVTATSEGVIAKTTVVAGYFSSTLTLPNDALTYNSGACSQWTNWQPVYADGTTASPNGMASWSLRTCDPKGVSHATDEFVIEVRTMNNDSQAHFISVNLFSDLSTPCRESYQAPADPVSSVNGYTSNTLSAGAVNWTAGSAFNVQDSWVLVKRAPYAGKQLRMCSIVQ